MLQSIKIRGIAKLNLTIIIFTKFMGNPGDANECSTFIYKVLVNLFYLNLDQYFYRCNFWKIVKTKNPSFTNNFCFY